MVGIDAGSAIDPCARTASGVGGDPDVAPAGAGAGESGIDHLRISARCRTAGSQCAYEGALARGAGSIGAAVVQVQLIAERVGETRRAPVAAAAAPHPAGANDDAAGIGRVKNVRRVEIAVVGKIRRRAGNAGRCHQVCEL